MSPETFINTLFFASLYLDKEDERRLQYMIHKKAQSQIITTILIILLVLAAIVIVWQVVSNTIREGSGEIAKSSTCLGISMTVTPVSATSVVVRREVGGKVLTGTDVVYIVNGANVAFPGGGGNVFNTPLSSKTITTGLVSGDVVEVALKLSDGTVCPISGKGTTP